MAENKDLFAPPTESELSEEEIFSPPSEEELKEEESDISMLEAVARSTAEGALMGGSEEAGASIGTALGKIAEYIPGTDLYESRQVDEQLKEQGFQVPQEELLETYRRLKSSQESRRKEGEEKYPTATTGVEIGGGILTGIIPGGAVAKGASLAAKAGRAAIAGGAAGGLEALGKSEAELTTGDVEEFKKAGKDAAVGTAGGAVLGSAIPVVGAGLKKIPGLIKKGVKVIPGTESAELAYKYGKEGAALTGKQIRKDTASLAEDIYTTTKELFKKLDIDDKQIQKLADEAGVKVSAGKSISEALEEAAKERAFDTTEDIVTRTKWVNTLKEIQGQPKSVQKLEAAIAKKIEKSELEGKDIIAEIGQTPSGRVAGVIEEAGVTPEGLPKITAQVGDLVPEKQMDLDNLSVQDLRDLITKVNQYTGIGTNPAKIADEDVIRQARRLAGELKTVGDDVVAEVAEKTGVEGTALAKKSKLLSALEEAGVGSKKGPKDVRATKDVNALRKLLGESSESGEIKKETFFRFLGEADQPLAEKASQRADQLQELRKLATGLEGREADISRYGLYKRVVGQGANVIGRGMKNLTEELQKDPAYIKTIADKMTEAGGAIASFAGPLTKALNSPERTRMAILYGLYTQPAFRKAMADIGEAIIPLDDE